MDIRDTAKTAVVSGNRANFDYSYNRGANEHTLVDKASQSVTTLSDVEQIKFDDGCYKCLNSLFGGLYKEGGVAAMTEQLTRDIR